MKERLWVGKLAFNDGRVFTAQAMAETREQAKGLINSIILEYFPIYELKKKNTRSFKMYPAKIDDPRYL